MGSATLMSMESIAGEIILSEPPDQPDNRDSSGRITRAEAN